MNDLEIMALLVKAKEVGVSMQDVEAFKASQVKEAIIQDPKELEKILKEAPQYTDEEVLFYATPYFDELQAIKAEKDKSKEGNL